ncbi:MAG: hypothetical protein GY787_16015 [Alteromonadales bacterium]|nr:hypothetical protein [Alteromonadales bacterium]
MIVIPDTPNTEPLSKECDHLKPIIQLLERNGNCVDRKTGILTDKGCGSFIVFLEAINTDLIKSEVELPSFIKISKDKYVFCERCWFTLEKRQKGKIYMGSKQIIW